MLSALRKTHQGVAVATSGETLSHQVMCLECFFQLRGFVESKFLPLRFGLDERMGHCPEVFRTKRDILDQLFSQTCFPPCVHVLSDRADSRMPIAIERFFVFRSLKETVGEKYATPGAQKRREAPEPCLAGKVARAIHCHGGVKAAITGDL